MKIVGQNGAGKTTTIELLATLIKPTSGKAWVGGHSILEDPDNVRKSIGIVYQDSSSDDILTARENLYLHTLMYGVPKTQRKHRVDEALVLVDLVERADDLVKTFSGGMRRRLELARGLSHHPCILFLDEPTLGLDPQTREHIWEYIEKMVKEENLTIILTTHYMEEADRLCDRVAIIDNGKILVNDSPNALKEKMGGDVLTLYGDGLKCEAFKHLPYVKETETHKGHVKLTVDESAQHLQEILSIAGDVSSIKLRSPALNDVFLHYTGREIRSGSAEELVQKQLKARRVR